MLDQKERKEAILRDILARVQQDGEYVARPHADRAVQFMPFAALKGYHELARECEHVPEPKRAMTEERAAELSQAIVCLSKGDMASVVHYEGDRYITTHGIVTEIDETFHTIRIVKKSIAFNDILSISSE